MNNRLFFIVAIAFSVCGTGCKSIHLSSRWCDETGIKIDGSAAEWNGQLSFPEGSKVGIGIANDDKYLYCCLKSEDRETVSKILMSGFSASFECKAQKGKRFGVHFPLGMKMAGPPSRGNSDGETDTAAMSAEIEASLQMLALLGPGKDDTLPMATRIAESLGVTVSINPSPEHCVYELKVPLNRDSSFQYAIGAGNDTLLSVTMETDKMTMPAGGPPGGGGGRGGPPGGGGGMGGPPGGGGGMGGPPGGGGGMGGPPGGGMGGMGGPPGGGSGGPPGSGSMPEPFKLQFTIHLAKK
jgi:hypothetical protein